MVEGVNNSIYRLDYSNDTSISLVGSIYNIGIYKCSHGNLTDGWFTGSSNNSSVFRFTFASQVETAIGYTNTERNGSAAVLVYCGQMCKL